MDRNYLDHVRAAIKSEDVSAFCSEVEAWVASGKNNFRAVHTLLSSILFVEVCDLACCCRCTAWEWL